MNLHVIEQLEHAFPARSIDPASAFAEWGGFLDAARFRDGVRGKRWTELEASFLEQHHDAIVFFGPSAIATYLPAYLATMVSRAPALDVLPQYVIDVLTRSLSPERFDTRFAQLTPPQRHAIATVLANFERELEGKAFQSDVRTALDSYWRRELGATP